jgi:hypothetical protein
LHVMLGHRGKWNSMPACAKLEHPCGTSQLALG